MLKNKIVLSFLFALSVSSIVHAQRLGNSPYSQLGVGDLAEQGFSRNIGMGGAGGASVSRFNINILHPSMLVYNSYVVYEFGLVAQQKLITKGSLSQNTIGGNLNYFAVSFPFLSQIRKGERINRWVGSVGLKPYSSISYNNSASGSVENSTYPVKYLYKGKGDLNKIFFSQGFHIVKSLSIGLEANYIFGPLYKESTVLLDKDSTVITIQQRINHNDLIFKPSIAFRKEIGKSTADSIKAKNNGKLFVSFAGSVDLSKNLSATSLNTIQRLDLTGLQKRADTTSSASFNSTLPTSYLFSFATDKYRMDNTLAWTIATDVSYTQWDGFSLENSAAFKNTIGVKVGGEYTPIKVVGKNFTNKLTYRFGGFYNQTPYSINNTQVVDMGVTAGFAFFIPKTLSQFNFSFTYGNRGLTLSSSEIKEHYLRFTLGVNINDVWFLKHKVD